jgi:hypothetical protein
MTAATARTPFRGSRGMDIINAAGGRIVRSTAVIYYNSGTV